MFVSLKKLKEFVDFEMSLEELDSTLTMLGIEVEHIVNYRDKYDKFFTAEVLSCEKHPKADKLSICEVSYGAETTTVVCGAPNVATGQKVVLGTSGAVVPAAGFKLEKRKIRDVVSNGMICSQAELELGTDASGIWVLPVETPVGEPVADYFGMNDIVLELGLTPNKADCLSHLGIARELAAKLGKPLKMPTIALRETDEKIEDFIKVRIDNAQKCPRYSARLIKNVKIQESPDWLKNHLNLIGIRPINAAVDVTNFVMFELGQPLHAFDYSKIEGKEIIVRTAIKEEKFTTLDGKERILDDYMILICDAAKPIALGGVMGGQNSEITDSTVDILLESAYFHPSTVRKTSKVLGLQSDSSYRFERGTDAEGVVLALNRAATLIAELCNGEIAEGYIDEYPVKIEEIQVKLRFERVRKIIGIEISNEEIKKMLIALGFILMSEDSDSAVFSVPQRRNDIFGEIDLIEEIARMYNYDNIQSNFVSSITFGGEGVNPRLALPPIKGQIRNYLVSRGFTEIITQNMIDSQSAALFTDNPVRIANPLGEELSIMRPSMLPSALKTINLNIRFGNPSLKLFEIGKIFSYSDDESNLLPGFKESEVLFIALVGKSEPKQWSLGESGWDFYSIKGILEDLKANFNLDLVFVPSECKSFSPNSLSIMYKGQKIGTFGEVAKPLLKHFDIDVPVYAMGMQLDRIYSTEAKVNKYRPVSPFPASQRDLAFLVDKSINAGDILRTIRKSAGPLLVASDIFDVYEGKNIEEGKKSLAYSLSFASPERTLVEDEIESAVKNVITTIEKDFSAKLRTI